MVRIIPIAGGAVTIIDDNDLRFIGAYKWYKNKAKNTSYVRCTVWDKKTKRNFYPLLHRLILNVPKGVQVDHINGNGLDNRRANIRLATNSQNGMNRKAHGTSSRFRGVYWHKKSEAWVTRIMANGERFYLGSFKTEEDAARIYNETATKLYGEFARLNEISE